jgi:hypothetical protein
VAPASVAASDLNGDGKPDLAVANGSSSDVSVPLNEGNGTFASRDSRRASPAPCRP